jgi:hypothetical protein
VVAGNHCYKVAAVGTEIFFPPPPTLLFLD